MAAALCSAASERRRLVKFRSRSTCAGRGRQVPPANNRLSGMIVRSGVVHRRRVLGLASAGSLPGVVLRLLIFVLWLMITSVVLLFRVVGHISDPKVVFDDLLRFAQEVATYFCGNVLSR